MAGSTHRFVLDAPYVTSPDKVPDDLRAKIAAGQCILFIGAGASLGATDAEGRRLPSWSTLIDELWGLLNEEAPQDPMVIAEARDLLHPEVGELLIVTEWIEKELGPRKFAEYNRKRLGTATNSVVHDILSAKNFRAVITTNYDDLVEKYWAAKNKSPFVVFPHTSAAQIGLATDVLNDRNATQTPVIKVHGTWSQPEAVVFGPRSYREIMFANDSFRQFMAHLFTAYTILFVGFSFKDPNFQSVLQWIYTAAKGNIPTHYATLENRGRLFKNYMRQNFNIRMLTYPVPPLDHSECLKILQDL